MVGLTDLLKGVPKPTNPPSEEVQKEMKNAPAVMTNEGKRQWAEKQVSKKTSSVTTSRPRNTSSSKTKPTTPSGSQLTTSLLGTTKEAETRAKAKQQKKQSSPEKQDYINQQKYQQHGIFVD